MLKLMLIHKKDNKIKKRSLTLMYLAFKGPIPTSESIP